jgi:hypothetical protein
MTILNETIRNFDFETAGPSDLAVLLEQVFNYHDPHSRDGGPIIVASGIIKKYEESVRAKAAPELYARVGKFTKDLRGTLGELDGCLRKLERERT